MSLFVNLKLALLLKFWHLKIKDPEIIEFVKKFSDKVIGAISIAPVLLLKAGILNSKPFMAGVNKE